MTGTVAAPEGAAARLWLPGLGSREHTANRRLFVFPHAGAGASSYRLARHFPDEIEVCAVQLPGRENRMGESPLLSADAVVDALAPLIASRTELPYAFLGHSMGALLSFAVARRLRALGAPLPRRMFLSAHRAPHLPDQDPLHALPDEALLARLEQSEFAGLDRELQEFLLPLVRADLTVCETYAHRDEEPLRCPFTVLGGADDEGVTKAELAAWIGHTSADFELRLFPGGHLYLRGAEQQLAESITHALTEWR
ncbi:thioesterase II family protein [Streptomyces sp. SAS_270]|uniref:thioesterase II family protein n=1 Tax=Streptomyces sp. SAS_270 TaxID=3412748 RepID=UPI00403C8106